MEKEIIVPEAAQRTLAVIAVEIGTIKRQIAQFALHASVEVGRRLEEAKAMVPHGDWGRWLAEEVDYSQSTANNLMRIAKEYGPALDGKSQTFGNLSYSQAVALLALPADERTAFAEQHPVEDMSARELKKAIAERDQARKGEEAALKRLHAADSTYGAELSQAEQREKTLSDNLAAQAKAAEKAKADAQEARAEAEALRKELSAAKAAPAKIERVEVPADTAALEAKLAEAEARAAAAEKSLTAFKPEVAGFQAIFTSTQQSINSMLGYIQKLKAKGDADIARKLCASLTALSQKLAETAAAGMEGLA